MKLIRLNNIISFQPEFNGQEITSIPHGVYKLWASEAGAGIEKIHDKYELPEIKGKRHDTLARMIGNDILDGTPVGALLTGLKGSGKTMTINHIANKAIEVSKYVVFQIDSYYPEGVFRQLIKLTGGKCVFLIDEYGKKFSSVSPDESRSESSKATELLEILSDSSTGPVIWLLADNHKSDISEYLINRPQRLKYQVHFDRLDSGTINELLADIADDTITDYLRKYVLAVSKELSYDVFSTVCTLAATVENLDELMDVMEYLNVPKYKIAYPIIKTDNSDLDLEFIYHSEDNEVTVKDSEGGNRTVSQFEGDDRFPGGKISWRSDVRQPNDGPLMPIVEDKSDDVPMTTFARMMHGTTVMSSM